LAGPPHGAALRGAESARPRGPRAPEDGPRPRPLLLRHQAALAAGERRTGGRARGRGRALLRHDRLLAGVEALGRGSARHRPDQRLAHAPLRHPRACVGRGDVHAPRRADGRAARRAAVERRVRLRDGLGLVKRAAESERLAKSVDSTLGVYLVPAFVGLGAPHWDAGARGALLGLTRGVTRAHVVRAALEALAYQTRDVADAMAADAGESLRALRVDGGAAANDFLMQFQADVLGVPVDRPRVVETTA